MYKIYKTRDNLFGVIKDNTSHKVIFLAEQENSDYQQFIQDVAEQGIEIVEGPDVKSPSYDRLRQQEYPSREEQLDMMYWDKVNGTTVWEDTIQAIKDKYPKTITGGTTIGEVPAWVQEVANEYRSRVGIASTT